MKKRPNSMRYQRNQVKFKTGKRNRKFAFAQLIVAGFIVCPMQQSFAQGPRWDQYLVKHIKDSIPLVGDVDGDGSDDLVVYKKSSGAWYAADLAAIRSAIDAGRGEALDAVPPQARIIDGVKWGQQWGDVPLLGDTNGNGIFELIIYRPREGKFYSWEGQKNGRFQTKRTEDGVVFRKIGKGAAGSIPLIGDMDGDGEDDLVTWKAGRVGWSAWNAGGKQLIGNIPWGNAGDRPLLANVRGDKREEIIVWRPSNHKYYIAQPDLLGQPYKNDKGRTPIVDGATYGFSDDFPFTYNRSVGIWRASTGRWYTAGINQNGTLRKRPESFSWGKVGDIPFLANMDNRGAADHVIYRPSSGQFYIRDGAGKWATRHIPPLDRPAALAPFKRMEGVWTTQTMEWRLADTPSEKGQWNFWGIAKEGGEEFVVAGRTNGVLARGMLIKRDVTSKVVSKDIKDRHVFEIDIDPQNNSFSGEIRRSQPFSFERNKDGSVDPEGENITGTRIDQSRPSEANRKKAIAIGALSFIGTDAVPWILDINALPVKANFAFDWSMPPRYGLDANNNGIIDLPNTLDYVMNVSGAPGAHLRSSEDRLKRAEFKVHLTADRDVLDPYYIGNPLLLVWVVQDLNGNQLYRKLGLDVNVTLPEGTYRVSFGRKGDPNKALVRSIEVLDHVVVLMGDSFAAGEGAPEKHYPNFSGASTQTRPVLPVSQWADPGVNPPMKQYSGTSGKTVTQPDWVKMIKGYKDNELYRRHIDNALSHRSSHTNGSRYARLLEDRDDKSSVTFINLAQSGAQIENGMLHPYGGLDNVPAGYYACSETGSTNKDDCDGWLVDLTKPNNWQPAVLSGPSCQDDENCHENKADARPYRVRGLVCPEIQNTEGKMCPQLLSLKRIIGPRIVDETIMSIGGNDAGFANILALLTVAWEGDIDISGTRLAESVNSTILSDKLALRWGISGTIKQLKEAAFNGRWSDVDYSNLLRGKAISVSGRANIAGINRLVSKYGELDKEINDQFGVNGLNHVTLIPPPYFGGTFDVSDLRNWNDQNGPFIIQNSEDDYYYCTADIDSGADALTGFSSVELAWTKHNVYDPLVEEMNKFITNQTDAYRRGTTKRSWNIIDYDYRLWSHGLCADGAPWVKSPGWIEVLDYNSTDAWFNAPGAVVERQTGDQATHKGIFHPNQYGFAYGADLLLFNSVELSKKADTKVKNDLRKILDTDGNDQISEARNPITMPTKVALSDQGDVFMVALDRSGRDQGITFSAVGKCPAITVFDDLGRVLTSQSTRLLASFKDIEKPSPAGACGFKLPASLVSTDRSKNRVYIGVSHPDNFFYDPVSGRGDTFARNSGLISGTLNVFEE